MFVRIRLWLKKFSRRKGEKVGMKELPLWVSRGCDVNHVDSNVQTPIFYAIKGGRADIVEYMLQNGINRAIVDKKNTTLY